MNERLKSMLTLDEAAVLIGASPETILRAVRSRDLSVWVELAELIRFQSERCVRTQAGEPDATHAAENRTINDDASQVHWQRHTTMDVKWPNGSVERFAEVYRAEILAGSRRRPIVIGFTERSAAGMPNRARAVVCFGEPPRQRVLVEFVGNDSLEKVTKLASPIKRPGSQQYVKPSEQVPPEYIGMPIGQYSDVVQGPNTTGSLAVVADRDDLWSMARHGIIRGIHRKVL